jgi:hypothetical protein
MKKSLFINLIIAGSLLVSFISCTKNDTKNATLSVRLTDAPANYDQVLVDIQDVQINGSTGDAGWQSLPVQKGVYNLLDFRNGLDTLLASIELPAGRISQLRLVLGSNNKVEKDGIWYNLSTPSAQQSGLKLNIQADLTEGLTYKLWIDFDAARSIVETGDGSFILKPVIRTFTEATSGAIKGAVLPVDATPVVSAIANGDTISTIAGADGNYLIRGVPQGTYKVIFEPKSPYSNKYIDNVEVTIGQVTNMGSINF